VARPIAAETPQTSDRSAREDLVAERTRIISRLRWHLHELDPGWIPPTKLERDSAFDKVDAHLSGHNDGAIVLRLALRLVEHLRLLTDEIDELSAEITLRVSTIAPSLLGIVGCGALTAAKNCQGNSPRRSVPLQRRLRASQWHPAATGVVIEQTTASLVTYRQSPTQHGATPHRFGSSTVLPASS
jgi:transposase